MMPRRLKPVYIIVLAVFAGTILFAQKKSAKHDAAVQQEEFGTREGRPVNLYTLKNAHGIEIKAMNYGGIILSGPVPDRKRQVAPVVLGPAKPLGDIPQLP